MKNMMDWCAYHGDLQPADPPRYFYNEDFLTECAEKGINDPKDYCHLPGGTPLGNPGLGLRFAPFLEMCFLKFEGSV